MDIVSLLRGILGLLVLVGIAFLLSNNKKNINWKLVRNGLLLQIIFAILIIKGDILGNFFAPLGWFKLIFSYISMGFITILDATSAGAEFIFGNLAISPGIENSLGFFFAFQVLPTIIFFASIMAVLYHLGIMQKVVEIMAWLMMKIMGTSGAESLSCTANIFVGQTEAPLMIKPFIKNMTKSELLTIMTGGMATIAGGVMASYIQMLGQSFSEAMNIPLNEARVIFASNLLGASIMAAPAALIISKIIFPEREQPETGGNVKIKVEKSAANVVEAAAAGASDGLKLALNVGAMLLAFIALIALLNIGLEYIGDIIGLNSILIKEYGTPLNLQLILGLILQFFVFLIGVPWHEALNFGSLMGIKLVLNEFVAYSEMSNLMKDGILTDSKSILMATYALCGFANFSSIAIQIGGLSPLAPKRRSDIASLGFKAVIGGTLATMMTATLAGVFF